MKTKKRVLWNIAYFDQDGICRKLEQMAAKGWMPQQAGALFWTFRKTQPQKLRFAVTYFPGASHLDPEPSEEQLEKEQLCAEAGWTLVLRFDAMQIFCTDSQDAVPIETDPLPQMENIHRTRRKNLMAGQVLSVLLLLGSLSLQLSELWRDPVDYLSSPAALPRLLSWVLLLLLAAAEVLLYLRWERKARKAAMAGVRLPLRSCRWLPWVVLGAVCVLLVLSYAESGGRLLIFLLCAAVTLLPILLGWRILSALQKKGFSKTANLLISGICIALLTLAGLGGILAIGLSGALPGEREPAGQYEWNGHMWEYYDDALPLTVEALTGAEGQWSREADVQETFLAAYGRYRQDPFFGQGSEVPELSYNILDVKAPWLFGFFKDTLLGERQDVVENGEVLLVDHYEPADAAPWGADEVYQLHWSEGVQDRYLVCWGSRIVEISFYWQPTAQQIAAAAAQLAPKG